MYAGSFNGDTFLFANEDGTIGGWRGALGTAAETLQLASPANVYKGLTDATIGGNVYAYAANFRNATIDVLKGNLGAPELDRELHGSQSAFGICTVQRGQSRRRHLRDVCRSGRRKER